jgi:hypothetical protein
MTNPSSSPISPAITSDVDDLQSQIALLLRVSTRLAIEEPTEESMNESRALSAIRDRLILSVTQDKTDDADRYYLADYSHADYSGLVMWLGADSKGYTHDLDSAGIYKKEQVIQLQRKNTVPVPVAMMKSFRIRKAVDIGDVINRVFESPEVLRVAVARFECWDPQAQLKAETTPGIIRDIPRAAAIAPAPRNLSALR